MEGGHESSIGLKLFSCDFLEIRRIIVNLNTVIILKNTELPGIGDNKLFLKSHQF